MALKQLLEFPLQDGCTIVVEVDEGAAGTQRAARPGEVAEQVQKSFEEALAPVAPAAEATRGDGVSSATLGEG